MVQPDDPLHYPLSKRTKGGIIAVSYKNQNGRSRPKKEETPMFANIPEVKLGIVAVSRDCFPIGLS